MLKITNSLSEWETERFTQINTMLKLLTKVCVGCQVQLGGSFAKGTYIKSSSDCDIFIKFPKQSSNISDSLERFLQKTKLPFERIHGSRDYFQYTAADGFLFEVVPVLDITNYKDAENVTDMSPMHVHWVKSRLTTKTCADIQKLKRFTKAQNLYGAESYIGGFSGHVIDILTIHYGGFEKVLHAAATTWKRGMIIDPENHLQNAVLTELLNESKRDCPLIVIDPIQQDRNAANALTKEKFTEFIRVSKKYLAAPSRSFFIPTQLTADSFLPGSQAVYTIALRPHSKKTDIAGAQLKKVFEQLMQFAHEHDFSVKGNFDAKQNVIFLGVTRSTLLKTKTVRGPPASLKSAVSAFAKDKDITQKDGYVYADVPRKFTHFKMLLDYFFTQNTIEKRVLLKNISEHTHKST